ncbi:MAG TPA: PAS domain S-box protein [Polyangiaceae bacterium]|nr:PAS domain S-box protein [Polyangiaceae bacterium]
MFAETSILVVDDDAVSRHVVEQALHEAGLNPVMMSSGAQALAWLEAHTPTVVLLDLMMPAPNGFTVLERIRQNARLADTPVVVLTGLDTDLEISRVFACGADDYVHKPFRPAELVARIRGQVRVRHYLDRLNQRERDQETVLELTQTLASTLDIRDILFTVVQRVAAFAKVDRCSIVLFGESGNVGYVLATSDDAMLRDLPIDLAKYPEIREVLTTGRALVIRDGTDYPLLRVVRQDEPNIGFNSFALLPILHEHGAMGVLFLRSKGKSAFDDYELSLVTTLTNAMAIALRNARILQSLRDATEKSTSLRAEAERRVQLFQRYADFFESAADGMVVIDREGKVLFANPRAREITGFSETELMALCFEDFLAPLERDRAARLLRGFLDGIYPRGVDIAITDKSAEQRMISVSFSSVLHEDNAVVFSFRDVTRERATAVELKQTKEFLESVIDSSVDGIVSANLRGTVLLFNRAAARIFGYAPSDVVGKMHVGKLYPPGGAREIMQKIRDPNLSGYGRLEDHRVDMLNSDGEPMQVQLSASLVIDNGHPIGSVGIFTDIREKLRMEARLSMAQEELRSREKQAIVAELAGAAAHELNQPLTSVIGYAELLRRQLENHPQLSYAASVIVGESERMAEIVRKVGKITKYETKSYVGAAKILDLEKASENEGGDLPP